MTLAVARVIRTFANAIHDHNLNPNRNAFTSDQLATLGTAVHAIDPGASSAEWAKYFQREQNYF